MQPFKYAHGVFRDYRVNQSTKCNAISDNISLRDRDNRREVAQGSGKIGRLTNKCEITGAASCTESSTSVESTGSSFGYGQTKFLVDRTDFWLTQQKNSTGVLTES